MVGKEESLTEKPEAEVKCRHYWLIESPQGPTSKGVCLLCGAEREFYNYWRDSFWEGDVSTIFELPTLPDTGLDREQGES